MRCVFRRNDRLCRLKCSHRLKVSSASQCFWSSQWSILWRYLSGLFSPPLLIPELLLSALSEVPAWPWLSVSTTVAPVPLPVVPTEVRRRGSGLLCAPASGSLSSPASFPWLLEELSPILNNVNSVVKNNMDDKSL